MIFINYYIVEESPWDLFSYPVYLFLLGNAIIKLYLVGYSDIY